MPDSLEWWKHQALRALQRMFILCKHAERRQSHLSLTSEILGFFYRHRAWEAEIELILKVLERTRLSRCAQCLVEVSPAWARLDNGNLVCAGCADDLLLPTLYEAELDAAHDIARKTADEVVNLPPSMLNEPSQLVTSRLAALVKSTAFGGDVCHHPQCDNVAWETGACALLPQ